MNKKNEELSTTSTTSTTTTSSSTSTSPTVEKTMNTNNNSSSSSTNSSSSSSSNIFRSPSLQQQQQKPIQQPIPSYALDKCLQLLSSNSDENKFVGLLLVKSTINQDDVDAMDKVYKSLGLSFISRLLQTPPTSKVEESISYHTLAINILSTFITMEYPDDRDAKSFIIYHIITRHSSLLESITKSLLFNIEYYVGQSEINVELIRNAMSILFSMLTFETKLKELEKETEKEESKGDKEENSSKYKLPFEIIQSEDNIQSLVKFIISLQKSYQTIIKNIKNNKKNSDDGEKNGSNEDDFNDDGKYSNMKELLSTTFVFLQLIIYKMHERNERKQFNKCQDMVHHLASLFKEIPNEIRFQLLPIFILIFQLDGVPKHASTLSNAYRQSLNDIGQTLYQIFISREFNKDEFKSSSPSDNNETTATTTTTQPHTKEYHDQSIILFSILFDLYGGEWILQLKPSSSSSPLKMGENLYYLACQHVRTELHIQLLQYPVQDDIGEDRFSVILSCYSILEDVIDHLIKMFEQMEQGDDDDNNSLTASSSRQRIAIMSTDMILKIRNIIIDCNAIMLEYLKSVVDEIFEKEPTQLVIMTTKRVGHFLAEEATLAEELSLSLVPIIEYYLQHRRDFGHFISFLLPGIYNYLLGGDMDDEIGYQFEDIDNTVNHDKSRYGSNETSKSEENQLSFFYKQHGDVALARFLSTFLVTFIDYTQDAEPQSANNSTYSSMISYDMTASSIVNGVIPMATSIICRYLSEDIRAISNGATGEPLTRFQESFQENQLIYVSLFLSVSDAIQHLSIFSEATVNTSVIGDDYRDRQLVMSNLTVLALAILRHLNECDSFSPDEYHHHILSRTIDSIINFYLLLEFPPSDQSNLLIWESLKSNWLYGIDLMSQCIDRYPTLRDSLTSKRWPPPDFTLNNIKVIKNNNNTSGGSGTPLNDNNTTTTTTNNSSSTTSNVNNQYNEFLDSITINTVNRSVGNLVRRLIESRSSST